MNGCLTLDVGTLLAILLFPNQDPLVAHTVLREVYSSLSYMKLIEAHFNTVRRSISGLDEAINKVRPLTPETCLSARHETSMKLSEECLCVRLGRKPEAKILERPT